MVRAQGDDRIVAQLGRSTERSIVIWSPIDIIFQGLLCRRKLSISFTHLRSKCTRVQPDQDHHLHGVDTSVELLIILTTVAKQALVKFK